MLNISEVKQEPNLVLAARVSLEERDLGQLLVEGGWAREEWKGLGLLGI